MIVAVRVDRAEGRAGRGVQHSILLDEHSGQQPHTRGSNGKPSGPRRAISGSVRGHLGLLLMQLRQPLTARQTAPAKSCLSRDRLSHCQTPERHSDLPEREQISAWPLATLSTVASKNLPWQHQQDSHSSTTSAWPARKVRDTKPNGQTWWWRSPKSWHITIGASAATICNHVAPDAVPCDPYQISRSMSHKQDPGSDYSPSLAALNLSLTPTFAISMLVASPEQ